ncbi:unnamed protein product [Rhizophagus irregularis]|nr:unnamed protein product [Rhizophagus irregularis]
MAPEVLKDHSYSKASNIYAFGGIIYEIVTGYPPFYNRPHDFQLALDICKGVHPDIPEHKFLVMIRCCFIYEDENKLSPRLTKEIEEFKSAHQVYQAEQIKIHPEAV